MEEFGSGADDDLLERARRLCLAAQAISNAMPVFTLRGAEHTPQGNQAEKHLETEKSSNGTRRQSRVDPQQQGEKSRWDGNQQSDSTPAAIPIPSAQRKRSLKKQHSGLKSSNQESLPEIKMSEEQRRLREAEKIRQAQERARTRVSRTNQFDQMEAERELEIKKMQSLQQEENLAEKERLAEQSRLRAEERIRVKRQFANKMDHAGMEKLQAIVPEKPVSDPVNLERFRRRTIERLQALPHTPNNSKPKSQLREPSEVADHGAGRDLGDHDLEKKVKEKKLRQETSERMRRLKAMEEEQRRKEVELVEQGLLHYKSRLKELDRVAKGMGPPRKMHSVPTQPVHPATLINQEALMHAEEEPSDIEHIHDTAVSATSMVEDHAPAIDPSVDGRASSVYGEIQSVEQQQCPEETSSDLEIAIDQEPASTVASDATTSGGGGRRKLRPWKRAPVPVLPAEFYSCKAMVLPPATSSQCASSFTTPASSNSYMEKFKSRPPSDSNASKTKQHPPSSRDIAATTAARLGSAARDRAQ